MEIAIAAITAVAVVMVAFVFAAVETNKQKLEMHRINRAEELIERLETLKEAYRDDCK